MSPSQTSARGTLTVVLFKDHLRSRTFHLPLKWLFRFFFLISGLVLTSLCGVFFLLQSVIKPPLLLPVTPSKEAPLSRSEASPASSLPQLFFLPETRGSGTTPDSPSTALFLQKMTDKPHWQLSWLLPPKALASGRYRSVVIFQSGGHLWVAPPETLGTQKGFLLSPEQGQWFAWSDQQTTFQTELPAALSEALSKIAPASDPPAASAQLQGICRLFIFDEQQRLAFAEALPSAQWRWNSAPPTSAEHPL